MKDKKLFFSTLLFQKLSEQESFEYFDLAENFNFGLKIMSIYVCIILIIGFVVFMINKLNNGKNTRNYERKYAKSKFIILLEYFSASKCWPIRIISLFLVLFMWFSLIFVTSSIKTVCNESLLMIAS